MIDEWGRRRFSREEKLAVLARMAGGESVSALSRELGIARKCLYQWRDRFRLGGATALRSRGRMTKAEVLAVQGSALGRLPPAGPSRPPPQPPPEHGELARAQARIAALERKVGQQELELDFFQKALRHTGEGTRPNGVPGGTVSTRLSRR